MLLLGLVLKLTVFAYVGAQTPIYFGFVPTDNATAAELLPPLEIALDVINNSTDVLPGYQMNYVYWNSECDRTTSLNRFLDHVLERCDGSPGGNTILGLIGCGCTEADLPVAEIVHRWNIPQISYAADSRMMKERDRFPNYHLLNSVQNLGTGLLGLLSAFNWSRLAVLSEDTLRFREIGAVIDSAINTTAPFPVNISHTILNESSVSQSVALLRGEYRVLYVNAYPQTAREILCYAIHQDLTFPRYVWILPGWYDNNWWVTSTATECTNDAVASFLADSRVLAVQLYETDDSEDLIVGGITRQEYTSRYRAAREASGANFIPEYPLIYDAVWTLALALNTTLANQNPATNSCSSDLPIENFTYSSSSLGRRVRDGVSMASFSGASGEIVFDGNGIRRQTYVTMLQYRNGVTVEFGRVDVSKEADDYNLTYAENENQSTVYPGVLPMDGSPVHVTVTYIVGLVGVCYTLAIIGLILTFLCFLFNIIFRKRKIVRLTSPNLNYFILLGIVLVNSTIFVVLIRTTDRNVYRIRCIIQTWTVTLGYLMAFGTVIAKLYRVAHIFKNPSPNKTAMQDWKLCLIILAVVSGGLVLLIVRFILGTNPSLNLNRENPTGVNALGITEQYYQFSCLSGEPPDNYYQIFYFGYMLLVLFLALYMAIQTRKVQIDVLNDYKWVSLIVYIGVPFVLSVFILTFFISPWANVSAGIYCIGLFLTSSLFLAFIFLPKVYAFFKDPKGENIFRKGTTYNVETADGSVPELERHGTMVTVIGRSPTLTNSHKSTDKKEDIALEEK